MALRIARVETAEGILWGVEGEGGLRRLSGSYPTTRAFFEGGGPEDGARARLTGTLLPQSRFLSPVTRESKFVCQATNYADHIREVGGDPSQVVNNILFTKASSCISPPDVDIVRPAHVRLLDYEVELGIVLKRGFDTTQTITAETLSEWVGGWVIVNDVTARDVQISHMQFHKSKSYRTFGPVGPWLVLPEAGEFDRLFDLELMLCVDGAVRQKAQAREMIFKPSDTLSELSSIMDLHAGDLIATGTPAGVALRPPPALAQAIGGFLSPAARFRAFMRGQLKRAQYLQPGQTVTASIRTPDGAIDLGVQTNRVVNP
ncbi:MAG: fumarylacetoacetate hydrolase family protein [Alphaproteobacteria bacterium]|nr:fumarylacetoacetate hydrolase family protein [Alphaproteobacteria bacterium]